MVTSRTAAERFRARREPADADVHRSLHQAIIDRRIAPGSALPEDRLAAAFGVSRTVIRKALQQLAHERLVDIVPNRGAAVARPGAAEARQVFEARRNVEQWLVRRAIVKASDAQLAGLVRHAEAEQQVRADDKPQRLKMSGDFHRKLADLAGNGVLQAFLSELVSRSSLILALCEPPGAVPCSHAEHRDIAAAMLTRDSARAVLCMDDHLRHIETRIDPSLTAEAPDFNQLFGARTPP